MAPLFLLNQITISTSFVLVVPRGQALQRQALQRAPWTQRQMSLHHDFFVTRSSHQDRRYRLARAGNDSSTSRLTSLGIGTQLDIAPAAPTTLSSYTKRTKLERIRPVLKFSSGAMTSRSRLCCSELPHWTMKRGGFAPRSSRVGGGKVPFFFD